MEEVKITLKGVEYKLEFTMSVLIDYQALTGMDPLNDAIIKDNINLKQIRDFLFVLLKQDNEELTLKECGNLVPVHEMGNVAKAIIKAFNVGMPEKEATEKKKVVKEKK